MESLEKCQSIKSLVKKRKKKDKSKHILNRTKLTPPHTHTNPNFKHTLTNLT